MHHNKHKGAYVDCAQYLSSQLKSIPCLTNVGILPESPEKCPVVIAKWEGIHPEWPVIILNSHYDVVPAMEEDWTVAKPFSAERKGGKVSSDYFLRHVLFIRCTILLTFLSLVKGLW